MSDLNISKLETEIQVYSKIYYDGLSELVYNKKTYYPISDEEFDDKLMMLSNLDPENEILSMTGFGFDTIIADNNGDKVNHEYPVNGIAGDRKKKSFKFTSELIDEENYLSLKCDGGSITCTYENGSLVRIVSRGNGKVGTDVTNTLKNIKSIPTKISSTDKLVIRGELILPVNTTLSGKDNIRNSANGIINTSSRSLTEDELNQYIFIAINIINETSINYYTRINKMKLLGFIVVPGFLVNRSEVEYTVNKMQNDSTMRSVELNNKLWEIPIDGYVIVGNESNDTYAYKLDSTAKETKIVKISWNKSSYGKYFPTIYFEKVNLDGANVQKASGGSYNEISNKGWGVGATILVVRSGGVIPYIKSTLNPSNDIPIPENTVVRGAHLFDKNHEVSELFFIRKIFNKFIPDGYGTDLWKRYNDSYPITSLDEFKDKVFNTESWIVMGGRISTKKQYLACIQTINSIKLWKKRFGSLLNLANIEGLGSKGIVSLKNHYKTIDNMLDNYDEKTIRKLTNILVIKSLKNGGKENLIKINNFFKDSEYYETDYSEVKDSSLQKIVLTNLIGSPLTKKEIQDKLKGKVNFVGSGKNADLCVYGKPNSSTYNEAQKHNVPIIQVNDWLRELNII